MFLGHQIFVSKCYECFHVFNFLCMQLDQIICDELNANWIVGLRIENFEVLEVTDSPLPSQ